MGAPSPFERQRGKIDKPLVIDAVKRGLAAAGVIFTPLALADCAPAFGQEPKSYVSRAAPPDTPTPDGIQSIRIGDGGTVTVNYFPTATPAPSVPTQRPEVSGIQAIRAPSPRPNPTAVPLRLTEPPATRALQPITTRIEGSLQRTEFVDGNPKYGHSFLYDPQIWTKEPSSNFAVQTIAKTQNDRRVGGVNIAINDQQYTYTLLEFYDAFLKQSVLKDSFSHTDPVNIKVDGKNGILYEYVLKENQLNLNLIVKDEKSRFWGIWCYIESTPDQEMYRQSFLRDIVGSFRFRYL